MATTSTPVATQLPGPGEGGGVVLQGGTTEPKAGIRTSEGVIAFLIVVLGGLLSSGLVVQTSTVGQAIVFGISALTAIVHMFNRTQLKVAHLAAGAAVQIEDPGERVDHVLGQMRHGLHVGKPTLLADAMTQLASARRTIVREMARDGGTDEQIERALIVTSDDARRIHEWAIDS